jgi:hypothetical protein
MAGVTVGVDHDVADLAGRLSVAAEQLVPENEPRADAAPDLDHHEVRRSLVAGEQVRGERGCAAVVGDDGRELVALLEDPRERQVLPVEADGPADRAGPVDDARRPDADPEDRAGRRGADLVDELVDDVDGLLAVAAVEVAADPVGKLATEVGEGGREGALAEVEGDDGPGAGVQRDQGRLLATRARATPDIDRQAFYFEIADQLADAGAGQASQAGDVSARDRPEVVKGAQDKRRVVSAGLRVGRLRREFRACHLPLGPSATSSVEWTKRIVAALATLSILRTKLPVPSRA